MSLLAVPSRTGDRSQGRMSPLSESITSAVVPFRAKRGDATPEQSLRECVTDGSPDPALRIRDRLAAGQPKRFGTGTSSFHRFELKEASHGTMTAAWIVPCEAIEDERKSLPITPEEIVRRQVDEFLRRVYELDRASQLQAATDLVFDYVDRLLSTGLIEVCNQILRRIQVNRLSTSLLRSFLTITAESRSLLTERGAYFARVEAEMTRQRGEATAKKILARLS